MMNELFAFCALSIFPFQPVDHQHSTRDEMNALIAYYFMALIDEGYTPKEVYDMFVQLLHLFSDEDIDISDSETNTFIVSFSETEKYTFKS